MSDKNDTTRIEYVHPDDPAGWLKPDEPFIVDGLDWSWAFVWHKDIPGFPGYKAGHDGSIWSNREILFAVGALRRPLRFAVGWRRIAQSMAKKMLVVGLKAKGGKAFVAKVHRLVLMAFVGPRTAETLALHWDDDPTNNRLWNLRWGTRIDNAADSIRNGRQVRGSLHPQSKIDEAIVEQFRIDYATHGYSYVQLSEKYGIPKGSISAILTGHLWKSAGGPLKKPLSPKLTKDRADKIRLMLSEGQSYASLASEFGVSRSMVSMIANGRCWR